MLAYTTHALTFTHSYTHSHTLTYTRSHTHTHIHTLNTHTHTHARIHYSRTHIHTLIHSHTLTYTRSRTHTHIHILIQLQESSVQFTLFNLFTTKPNMVLAKRPRPALQDTVTFDSLLQSQNSPSDYLATCRLKQRAGPKTETTPTSCAPPMDDVIIVSMSPGGGSSPPGRISGVQKRKYKLFQFHDNYRPAYYGTWSSVSAVIGPRNPFKLDKVCVCVCVCV